MKENSWYSIHRISARLFQVVNDFMRDIFLFCLFVFFFTKLRKQTIKAGVSVLQLLLLPLFAQGSLFSFFFICTFFNARCSSHYGHFSTVQSIFRKHCLSFPLFFVFSCLVCAVLCTSGVYLRERRICPTSWWRQIKPVVCPQSLPELGLVKISARRRRSCQSLSCPQKEKSFLLNEQRERGKGDVFKFWESGISRLVGMEWHLLTGSFKITRWQPVFSSGSVSRLCFGWASAVWRKIKVCEVYVVGS